MSTAQIIPADVMADLEEVCRQAATGRIRNLELFRRIHERAEKVTEEILQKHGVLNVAVDLIREGRDEE